MAKNKKIVLRLFLLNELLSAFTTGNSSKFLNCDLIIYSDTSINSLPNSTSLQSGGFPFSYHKTLSASTISLRNLTQISEMVVTKFRTLFLPVWPIRIIAFSITSRPHILHVLEFIRRYFAKRSCTDYAFLLEVDVDDVDPENFSELVKKVFLEKSNLQTISCRIKVIFSNQSSNYFQNYYYIFELMFLKNSLVNFQSKFCTMKSRFLSWDDFFYNCMITAYDNFYGITLKVVAEELSGSFFIRSNDSKTVKFSGEFPHVYLRDFEDSLNFTSVAVEGEGWLEVEDDGDVTGMGRQIIEEQADLSISTSLLGFKRGQVVTFLQPFYSEKLYAFFKQPLITDIQNIFFMPFELKTWIAVLITLGIFATLLKIVFIVDNNLGFGISDALIFCVSILRLQGYNFPHPINSTSSRVTLVISFLFGVVTYSIYSASILSKFHSTAIPITDVQGLLRNKYILMSFRFVDSIRIAVSDDHLVNYFVHYADTNIPEENSRILKMIKSNQRFAFLSDEARFNAIVTGIYGSKWEGICQSISKLEVGSSRSKSGMFIRKDSYLKEYFNRKLINLMEIGLNFHHLRTYKTENMMRCMEPPHSPKTLELSQLVTSFMVLAFGFGISVIALLIEHVSMVQK